MKNNNTIKSSRALAREVVYKFLFAKLFNDEVDNKFLNSLCVEYKLNENDTSFAKKLATTVVNNLPEITDEISKLSHDYSYDRIYSTGKCALFIGMTELKYFDDIPPAASIDQAVNLASKFSTETSLSFINGILAAYNKKLQG